MAYRSQLSPENIKPCSFSLEISEHLTYSSSLEPSEHINLLLFPGVQQHRTLLLFSGAQSTPKLAPIAWSPVKT
jgi:hypothetical protein